LGELEKSFVCKLKEFDLINFNLFYSYNIRKGGMFSSDEVFYEIELTDFNTKTERSYDDFI